MLQQILYRDLHDLNKRRGPQAHQKHEKCEPHQHPEFSGAYILQFGDMVIGNLAEYDPLNHPQRISSAED